MPYADKSLATFLYESLSSRGYSVFLDVEIPPGLDWQEVISAQIQTSDLFVVLLSKASTAHGYVVAETVMAKESETVRGNPKIFPVRLAYTKNLPLRMSAAIGHLQHFEWRSASDNDALLGALLLAVGKTKGSAPPSSLLLRGDHFIVTGSMWQANGSRESLSGTTIVPVSSGQETSLAVTRAKGPGLFNVKVTEDGGLEVAIWKSANYRRVDSQPGRFITMLEGDSHGWCFAQYTPPTKRSSSSAATGAKIR